MSEKLKGACFIEKHALIVGKEPDIATGVRDAFVRMSAHVSLIGPKATTWNKRAKEAVGLDQGIAVFDVAEDDSDALNSALDRAAMQLGPPSVLVYIAPAPLEKADYLSAESCITKVASAMVQEGQGRIVIVAKSHEEKRLAVFTRNLALTLSGAGVTVNTVAPAIERPGEKIIPNWEIAETVAIMCLPATHSISGVCLPMAAG